MNRFQQNFEGNASLLPESIRIGERKEIKNKEVIEEIKLEIIRLTNLHK